MRDDSHELHRQMANHAMRNANELEVSGLNSLSPSFGVVGLNEAPTTGNLGPALDLDALTAKYALKSWPIDKEGCCDNCAEDKPLVRAYEFEGGEPWICAECAAEEDEIPALIAEVARLKAENEALRRGFGEHSDIDCVVTPIAEMHALLDENETLRLANNTLGGSRGLKAIVERDAALAEVARLKFLVGESEVVRLKEDQNSATTESGVAETLALRSDLTKLLRDKFNLYGTTADDVVSAVLPVVERFGGHQ